MMEIKFLPIKVDHAALAGEHWQGRRVRDADGEVRWRGAGLPRPARPYHIRQDRGADAAVMERPRLGTDSLT
jgi:hypothetical protein